MIRWIPVEYQLPPKHPDYQNLSQSVLVILDDGTREMAFCRIPDKEWYYQAEESASPVKIRKTVIMWAKHEDGGV